MLFIASDYVPPPPQFVSDKQLEPPPPPPAVTASVPRETCTADRPPPPEWPQQIYLLNKCDVCRTIN